MVDIIRTLLQRLTLNVKILPLNGMPSRQHEHGNNYQ